MSLIFKLSRYLSYQVISEWLDLEELCVLDSSLCCRAWRSLFCLIISQDGFRFSAREEYTSKNYYTWLALRCLAVKDVFLRSRLNEHDLAVYFQKNAINFLTLSVTNINDETTSVSVLLSVLCTNLQSITFHGVSFVEGEENERILLRYIENNASTLQTISLEHCDSISLRTLKMIVQTATNLRTIGLKRCSVNSNMNETSELLVDEKEYRYRKSDACHHINTLILREIYCPPNIPSTVISLCGMSLRTVDFSGCSLRVTDTELFTLSQANNNTLADVNLSGCQKITDRGLLHLVTPESNGYGGISSLNILNCPLISDVGLVSFVTGHKNITSLSVGIEVEQLKQPNMVCYISDASMEAVSTHNRNLTELNIHYCRVTVRGLLDIARNCVSLITLLVHNSNPMYSIALENENPVSSAMVLRTIAKSCSQFTALTWIHVDAGHEDGLRELVALCRLKRLVLEVDRVPQAQLIRSGFEIEQENEIPITGISSDLVDPSMVYEESSSLSLITNLSSLETLHIRNSAADCSFCSDINGYYLLAKHCSLLVDLHISMSMEINDHNVVTFSKFCPQLTSIHLSDCYHILGDCMHTLCRTFGRQLKALTVANNNRYTGFYNGDLCSIAQYCCRITSLDLSENMYMTTFTIAKITRHCKQLILLNISSCISLNDHSLVCIAVFATHLNHLIIRENEYFSDAGVNRVSEKCVHLQTIDMTDCDGISLSAVAGVLSHCKCITYIAAQNHNKAVHFNDLNSVENMGINRAKYADLVKKYPAVNIVYNL